MNSVMNSVVDTSVAAGLEAGVDTPLDFTTAEGLRLMLVRLRYCSVGWDEDPQASELMRYVMDKYAALARKYGYEPVEAAVAAFEAMHTRAVRVAIDPWAVITHAVELTLIYDQRADGLLCSNHQARRETGVERHDADRFCEREDILDYHPAFAIPAPQDAINFDAIDRTRNTASHSGVDPKEAEEEEPTNAWVAVDDAVRVFVAFGWPKDVTRSAIEYICTRLIRAGNRRTTFEALRRDRSIEALMDVDHRTWLVFLRVVLGNQHPDRRHTTAGRGMLLRLVVGDQPEDLIHDPVLAAEIATIRHPRRAWTGDVHV